jgi:hypothetical protein
MTPREIARALAVTSVIADAAKARKDELRADLADALDALGADSAKADLPDGTTVAKASLIAGKARASVIDEDALTGWVAESAPTEVVFRVRESYRKHLLDRLEPGPDGTAVDPTTGEIVPGVRYSTSTPYVSLRFDRDGRDAVIDALRQGAVSLDLTAPTPALPTGDPA